MSHKRTQKRLGSSEIVLPENLLRDKIMESRRFRRRSRHQSQMLDESSTSLGFKTKKRKLSEVRAEEFLGRTIEALFPSSSSSDSGGPIGMGREMQPSLSSYVHELQMQPDSQSYFCWTLLNSNGAKPHPLRRSLLRQLEDRHHRPRDARAQVRVPEH